MIRETRFGFCFFKTRAAGVFPAALGKKCIPDFDLFRVRLVTHGEAPIEDLFITAAFQCPCAEVVEAHAQEPTQTVVEGPVADDNSKMIALRQFSCGIQPDLVENTSEDDDAAGQVARAAEWKAHGEIVAQIG